MEEAIAQGLRAQLALQSLLTGQLYVNLVLRPDTPASLAKLEQGALEIPTIPTIMAQLEAGLQRVPLANVPKHLYDTLEGSARLLQSQDLAKTLASVGPSGRRRPDAPAAGRQGSRSAAHVPQGDLRHGARLGGGHHAAARSRRDRPAGRCQPIDDVAHGHVRHGAGERSRTSAATSRRRSRSSRPRSPRSRPSCRRRPIRSAARCRRPTPRSRASTARSPAIRPSVIS